MEMFELKSFNLDIPYPFRQKYANFIGVKRVVSLARRYFDNVSPITGKTFCKVAQSDAADINLALDATHAAQEKWGKTSATEHSNILVSQIIPWNFPILMAYWKLAPALAAGCSVVIKPAEQTPASIMVRMELISDLLPPDVINIVNGFGKEAGEALVTSTQIAEIAFAASTPVGQRILRAAADNLIPPTVELGGKSPNIFFADVVDDNDQAEVCTPSPSRILVQESIYERFRERAIARAWAAPSRPRVCRPTATTCTRHTPPLVVTKSRALAARRASWLWPTTNRQKLCCSATTRKLWTSSGAQSNR